MTGPLSDPLAMRFGMSFDGDLDFTDSQWLAQIRRYVDGPLVAELTYKADQFDQTVTDVPPTDQNPDGKRTRVSIMFDLPDPSAAMEPGRCYVFGVKCEDGTAVGEFTLIAEQPIVGYQTVAREEPQP